MVETGKQLAMHRPVLVALAIGVLVPLSLARSQAPDTQSEPPSMDWSACQVIERDGTLREVRCPGFQILIMRAGTLGGADGLGAVARAHFGEEAGTPGAIRAGRRTAPIVELASGVLAAPLPDVITVCRGSAASARERCEAAIRWMLTAQRLPPGVEFPAARLSFLGVPLVIPGGCSLSGPERIVCPQTGAAFDWREHPSAAHRTPSQDLDAFAALVRQRMTVVSETTVPCSMRGATGVGRRLRATARGQTIDVVACALDRDGVRSNAQCMGPVPAGAAFPVPCDGVFDGVAP